MSRRISARLLRGCGVIAGVAVLTIGVALAVLAIGGASLASDMITKWAAASTGRAISIRELRVSWGSPIRVEAEDIRVANAPWGEAPDLLKIPHVTAEIDRGRLFRLHLAINALSIAEPQLALETNEANESNWDGIFAASAGSSAERLDLQHLEIREARITRRNKHTRAEWELVLEHLEARSVERHQPIQVSTRGAFQQKSFSADAQLGPLAQLHSKGWPSPVHLEAQLEGNRLSLAGTASEPLTLKDLDLRVEMAGDDLPGVLALFDVPHPRVPLYRLAGHFRHNQARWTIDDLEGQIGKTHLAGRVLIDLTQRVRYIRADLRSSYLELADLKGFYGGVPGQRVDRPSSRNAKDSDERIIPNFRVPTEQLRSLAADVRLEAPRVKPTAGVPFENLAFAVSLREGTLRVENARLGVANGAIAGRMEIRAAETPPQVNADIQATQIDWKRFFAAMNVSPAVKQTSGIIGIFAKLRSSGGDQRQMFANMSGEISVFVRDAILGGPATSLIDLRVAEGLGLAERGQRVLPIPCGIGHFLVSGGVATAETLLLATSSTNILGAGNINFADETLFLDLKPQPKPGGASLGNVRVPIRIRGTFGRREISADKGGLAPRLGTALGLAPVEIPAPLLPLLERGLGRNACASSFVSANVPGGAAGEGSSAPSERARPSNR